MLLASVNTGDQLLLVTVMCGLYCGSIHAGGARCIGDQGKVVFVGLSSRAQTEAMEAQCSTDFVANLPFCQSEHGNFDCILSISGP